MMRRGVCGRACRLRTVPTVERRSYSVSCGPEVYIKDEGQGIVCLTMDRPSARNALSRKMVHEMTECLQQLHGRANEPLGPRALVMHSRDSSAFCAGADLKERKTMGPDEVNEFLLSLRMICKLLQTLRMPTIAAIDGVAMGGGLELALCTDLRVVGERARIALPETKLGIIPGAGGTQRLSRLLGSARAKELIFTGRTIDGAEAFRLGIAQSYAKQAFERALEMAHEIAGNAPLAVQQAKCSIDAAEVHDLESGLDYERAAYETLLQTRDRQEGLLAFAQKRLPQYIGK